MNIEKINSPLKVKTSPSFLSKISAQIFAICKEDSRFNNRSKLDNIDIQLKEINKKIAKQDALLNKSKKIKDGFNERFEILNDKLNIKREELLESLGSEL